MFRQSFITKIKNVTEKKQVKSLIRFHSASKINYNRGGKKKKTQQNPQVSTEKVKKNKNNKCFS